jgi:hypothetical protein
MSKGKDKFMENNNITKKEIEEIKSIKLTREEKEEMLAGIFSAPAISPYAPIKSSWKFVHKPFAYFALFLLLLVSGSTISYASLRAIPGDKLYAVKIKITEPILDAVSFTPAAKAEREVNKALSRLDEAEQLAKKKKLTPSSRADLEKKFEKNVEGFDSQVRSVQVFSGKKAEDLRSSFESSLDIKANSLQHSEDNDKLTNNEDETEAHLLGKKVREIRERSFKNKNSNNGEGNNGDR